MEAARNLSLARCAHHPAREAAARCPACARFCCRECVSEHGERMLCAACIAGTTPRAAAGRMGARGLRSAARALCGLAFAWLCFWLLGLILIAVPDASHPKPSGAVGAAGEQGPGGPGGTAEDR